MASCMQSCATNAPPPGRHLTGVATRKKIKIVSARRAVQMKLFLHLCYVIIRFRGLINWSGA
jgi:hypothetical protein